MRVRAEMPPGAVEVGHLHPRQHLRPGRRLDLHAPLVHDVPDPRQIAADVIGRHQKVGAERRVADVVDPQRRQREPRAVRHQPAPPGGQQFAAATDEPLQLRRQRVVHRHRVGQHDQGVGGKIRRRVDHVELQPQLLQHPHRAQDGRHPPLGLARVGERLGRQHADLHHRLRPLAPRFLRLDRFVNAADQVVGRGVDLARRVELVADAAPRAQGEHVEALELQGGGVLVGVEVAPARVELAGLADDRHAQRAGVAGGLRQVQVAPPAAWQRLELQVRVRPQRRPRPRADVAGVVEDRAVGAKPADVGGGLALPVVDSYRGEARDGRRVFGVHARRVHRRQPVRRVAGGGLDDVQEQARPPRPARRRGRPDGRAGTGGSRGGTRRGSGKIPPPAAGCRSPCRRARRTANRGGAAAVKSSHCTVV